MRFRLFFSVFCLSSLAFVSSAQAVDLTAHKALYDIKLVETRNDSQIVNVSGQMLYEWHPSCEAWISRHKFDMRYEYADNPAVRTTSTFYMHEPFDGKSMNFITQRRQGGYVFEELRGYATIGPDGGKVDFSMPDDQEFDLPAGTLFPTAHTMEVIKRIKAGEKFFHAVIFDGGDKKGAVESNVFIGAEIAPEKIVHGPGIDPALLNVPAHKLRLAFFPLSESTPEADYEMDLVFHENGIISDMRVEYSDFTVTQKLVALEPLPSSCDDGDN